MVRTPLSPQHPPTHMLGRTLQLLAGMCMAAIAASLFRTRVAAQGLVEYALVLVLIAIVVMGSLTMVGENVSQVFERVSCSMRGGTMHVDHGNGNSNRCT